MLPLKLSEGNPSRKCWKTFSTAPRPARAPPPLIDVARAEVAADRNRDIGALLEAQLRRPAGNTDEADEHDTP